MCLFQRIFGGKKKDEENNVTPVEANNITPAEVIQRLSSTIELFYKKQEHLESQIEVETANIIRCSKLGNKRGALNALKKKKKYERALLKTDETLTILEDQRDSPGSISEGVATGVLTAEPDASSLYNDVDLEDELYAFLEEYERKEVMKIEQLPNVPITTPTNKIEEKEDALRELEAWGV